MNKKNNENKKKLIIRNASISDVKAIQSLTTKVYKNFSPYTLDMLKGQINSFPAGHFVATYGDKIVGYCATIKLNEALALSKHTWNEATGGGYGITHNSKGQYLYGYEISVDPDYRGLKIGARFYNERKKLCKYMHLKGVVFGGRLPRFYKKIKDVKTPEEYISRVEKRKILDPVLYFQLRNGFKPIGVLDNYLPTDKDSLGYACHLLWNNPEFEAKKSLNTQTTKGTLDKVRIAVVQYEQRKIKSFEEFKKITTYFVDVVSDYKSDFVLFPELFTVQLLSIENESISPMQAIEKLTGYTEKLKTHFRELAIKYNVNIIAGSHPTKNGNDVLNTAFVFLRNGSIFSQDKIHPTPNEKFWWNIKGGNQLSVINTDCGPIGVLICYDSEFPELARHLADQGANILFIPFLTDEKQSYNRVRYCAQARAIENQCYVAMSGNVGNLPRVQNMDIHYAQSCIMSPCDFMFARDGILSDTTANVETVAIADVRIQDLYEARSTGTVQNLRDRRQDLYQIKWLK